MSNRTAVPRRDSRASADGDDGSRWTISPETQTNQISSLQWGKRIDATLGIPSQLLSAEWLVLRGRMAGESLGIIEWTTGCNQLDASLVGSCKNPILHQETLDLKETSTPQ